MSSYVQPRGDATRRVNIPHTTSAAEEWELDGAYTFFEGRVFPVGARGEHVSNTWSLTSVWKTSERPQAEAFLQLLRDRAQETDARLDVHVETRGTAVDFVGETHEVPQELTPDPIGLTATVAFQKVDGS